MNLGELHRNEYGRVVASLIRSLRDFTLAEDALQDAFLAASTQWPVDGVPANPAAWLFSTAYHKAIDQIRRRALADAKHRQMLVLETPEEVGPAPDDKLRLIFTCCHPALPPVAQVALTLRTLCGLTTEEIADGLALPATTLAQRIVRAKTRIRADAIPYVVPEDDALAERLDAVLAVIYLVFNEGYAASAGPDLIRTDLCDEAIRLGRDLVALMPGERDAKGLLALMLLSDARRATRTDVNGELVRLEDQDRAKWNRAQIAEGVSLAASALRDGLAGPYTLQAAIASLHARAPSMAQTDWQQIAALYALLAAVHPSQIVELNRAVAVAFAEGIEKGLALLERIDIPGYYLLPAARADLLRRLGRRAEAAEAYRAALNLVQTDPERRFLESRLRDVMP